MLARPPDWPRHPHRCRPHRDKTKGSVEFIPCCTAGAERLAEGLGDRSLERTEQAAERAAGPGLAVDQQRGMWRGRERDKRRGRGAEMGGGEEQQVNHRRHFTWTTRPPSSLATKPGVAGSFHISPIRRNPIHSLPISHSNCVALVRNLRTLKAKVCDLNAHLKDSCIHGCTAFVGRVIQGQVSWRRAHPQRCRPLEGRKAIDTQQILEPSQFLQVVRTVWTNGVNSESNITRLAVFLSPALHLLQAGESVYWKHAVF